jgi:hypothetical protein
MKREWRGAALAFALLAAPIPAALSAATLDARSLVYLPVLYHPGEEVLAQGLLFPEGRERLAAFDMRRGAGLSEKSGEADPELRELKLAKTDEGWLLSLRFVPWSPGASAVASVRYKGITIPAFPYSAATSLGPEDRDPSPPRRQRDPPGTLLYLYLLAGGLIVIALGVAGAAAYLLPAARTLLARWRAAQAYRRFVTSLDYLLGEAGSAEPAVFFAALSRAFRLYLASRILPDAPALSSPELAALPEEAFPSPATRGKTAALLAYADRVRYGGERPGPSALESAIAEARAIGEANEEALLARL